MSFGDSDFLAAYNGPVRDTAIPRFYVKPFKMNKASEEAGRPVYENREYVEILTPGTKSTPDRPVRSDDINRWPKQYAAFKSGQAMSFDGMPLSEWTMTDKAQVEHLRNWNIHTVEHLSQLTDGQMQSLGLGIRELVTKAKLWLEQAKDNSGIGRVVAENETLKRRTETMEDQLREQAQQIKALLAREGGASPPTATAPVLSAEAIQAMIAQGVAAALEGQAVPKNKGGRPRKPQPDDHSEQPVVP